MNGEFRSDISRDTFDPKKHFARVLMQQGRVQLDADWNEQADILRHYIQTIAMDLMGPFAGPENGFEITPDGKGFGIGYGRYYVEGILCENEEKDSRCGKIDSDKKEAPSNLNYIAQLDYPIGTIPDEISLTDDDLPLLVYLDVWERHISCVEDDDIREKALGGPDTAARSKVIWQVKVLKSKDEISKKNGWPDKFNGNKTCSDIIKGWPNMEILLQPSNRGCLSAKAKIPKAGESNPCIISPDSRYRGAENQLYRVEIHRGGFSSNATYKWSRDNGTIVFPISSINGDEVTLEHLGRDDRSSLSIDDWVEVIDDAYSLLSQSRPSPLQSGPRHLAQVKSVSLTEMKVTLNLKDNLPNYEDLKHPLLRRWDYKATDPSKPNEPELADEGFSGLLVKEGDCSDGDSWLTLEDGVQICFQAKPEINYQAGDYWLIPARTVTGDIEWPYEVDKAGDKKRAALPPHGVDHHYAPLAVIYVDQSKGKSKTGNGTVWAATNCRCKIIPSNDCPKDQ